MCNAICYTIHFQHKFIDWTSGNNDIDKFIQDTHLLVHYDVKKVLEWIPFDRLDDIKYIAKIGFGKANWIDGCITNWDSENQNWKRYGSEDVILKSLNNLKNIKIEFTNEVQYNKFNENKILELLISNNIQYLYL
jgi:hypothetical protein